MSKHYDITGTDLRALVSRVYELSNPVGMGFLHYSSGPINPHVLDAEMADVDRQLVRLGDREGVLLSLDYVEGRACKFSVWRKDGRLLVDDSWFDHSPTDLADLLASPGIVNNGLIEVAA